MKKLIAITSVIFPIQASILTVSCASSKKIIEFYTFPHYMNENFSQYISKKWRHSNLVDENMNNTKVKSIFDIYDSESFLYKNYVSYWIEDEWFTKVGFTYGKNISIYNKRNNTFTQYLEENFSFRIERKGLGSQTPIDIQKYWEYTLEEVAADFGKKQDTFIFGFNNVKTEYMSWKRGTYWEFKFK
ncbi:hypothetical protein [Spiroplasma cantharicola]|uniref:Lipoprotein n=1 Tax=Spiroplasma cantharicola TaxID=362837 RepID=A0A0M4K1A8_9MOLU|nr:hypothetical protein [Spiroplasma cantharicola]ALD66362.1 hypothetical protein SCANT_v1c04560 [Spiroplasma cantharicola]